MKCRLIKKQSAVRLLAVYTYSILIGLKDSYLIDCHAFDKASILKVFLKITEDLVAEESFHSNGELFKDILILQLRTDFVLTTSKHWEKTLGAIYEDDIFPLVISIDGDRPELFQGTALSDLKQELERLLGSMSFRHSGGRDCDFEPRLIDLEECSSSVGFPFICGWILSYPAVYLSRREENCLGMELLRKVSLQAELEGHLCDAASSISLDIKEFTIPQSILDDCESVAEKFRASVRENEMKCRMIANAHEKVDGGSLSIGTRIRLSVSEELVRYPRLIL